MAEFWRTKGFKALNKIWILKLEESGFNDIENEKRQLKHTALNSNYNRVSELERETRLEYYQMLSHLVNNTEFPTELEKLVMTRYSEGIDIKGIVAELSSKGISQHRMTVGYIIRRWQFKWGMGNWTLKQMKLTKPID